MTDKPANHLFIRKTAPKWTYAIRVPWAGANVIGQWAVMQYGWNRGLRAIVPEVPEFTLFQVGFLLFFLRSIIWSTRWVGKEKPSWLRSRLEHTFYYLMLWFCLWLWIEFIL